MEENSSDSELATHLIVLRPNPKKMWCMRPYAGVDYNLTLCPLQSRLQHVYHGQPYARVDFTPPVRVFGFGLSFICRLTSHLLFKELGPLQSYSGGGRRGRAQVVQLPRQGHEC
jgi:hypothetical protein